MAKQSKVVKKDEATKAFEKKDKDLELYKILLADIGEFVEERMETITPIMMLTALQTTACSIAFTHAANEGEATDLLHDLIIEDKRSYQDFLAQKE